MDYKLIALFNMGLVYLESSRHTWLWLIINPVEATFLSDANSARWHHLRGRRTNWLPILVESIIV